MGGFVKTDTVLDRILTRKLEEVETAKRFVPLSNLKSAKFEPPRNMRAALQRKTIALIGEVKKASPSKGVLIENFDPVEIGTVYAQNGAAAISVLTDVDFFQGHLDYLTAVRQVVSVPVLRKDFIVDPYQVYEARAAGADAVLLIVGALEDRQLADLHALIYELEMSALVEVHDEPEMERALKLGARLIGVNNRDLKSFEVDLSTTERLAKMVSGDVVLVAESGIRDAADVQYMGKMGAHAVLVGESLVKSSDLGESVRVFSSQPRVPDN